MVPPESASLTRRGLLLAGIAAGLAACRSTPRGGVTSSTTAPGPTIITTVSGEPLTVALIGDSIATGARVPLESALASKGFGRIEFDALPGRRIKEGERPGLTVLDEMLAGGLAPDVWLIELGSNDLGRYPGANESAYRALIDDVIGRLDPATPLVWVDTYSRLVLEDCEQFNMILHAAMAERSNGAVARWYERCTAEPDLVPDGLHPAPGALATFAEVAVEPIGILT
jgi:lysophospholipase L1-like esterase